MWRSTPFNFLVLVLLADSILSPIGATPVKLKELFEATKEDKSSQISSKGEMKTQYKMEPVSTTGLSHEKSEAIPAEMNEEFNSHQHHLNMVVVERPIPKKQANPSKKSDWIDLTFEEEGFVQSLRDCWDDISANEKKFAEDIAEASLAEKPSRTFWYRVAAILSWPFRKIRYAYLYLVSVYVGSADLMMRAKSLQLSKAGLVRAATAEAYGALQFQKLANKARLDRVKAGLSDSDIENHQTYVEMKKALKEEINKKN